MKYRENKMPTRAQLISATRQAYIDLFVTIQSALFTHWMTLELTFAQVKALLMLSLHEALTVSQLAKSLGVGKPAASIVVQQLVERGLVTRTEHEADRRHTVVRLSEQGAQLSTGRRKEREAQWRRWLSHLSDEELNALAHGLSVLKDVVHAEQEQSVRSRDRE